MKSRHLIYLAGAPAKNAGGPNGYVWQLLQGLDSLPEGAPAIERMQRPAIAPLAHHVSKARSSLRKWRAAISVAARNRDWSSLPELRPLAGDTVNALGRLPRWAEQKLSDPTVASVLCNSTASGLQAHRSLVHLGRREEVGLVLITHSPEMPAVEKVATAITAGVKRTTAESCRAGLTATDLAAFRAADLLIFPVPEAMEPYFETSVAFKDAIAGKDIRFVPTGTQDPLDAADALESDHTGPLRLAFVGRHNTIKGYDLLCAVVPAFLDEASASIALAGSLSRVLPPPSHPRWKELERIPDPTTMILNSDVVLLPNQRTYFDLIALETMALGRPLVASATGGNKALARVSPGVILFDPTKAGLLQALRRVAATDRSELAALGRANRAAYKQHFTIGRFAECYRNTIADWQSERRN